VNSKLIFFIFLFVEGLSSTAFCQDFYAQYKTFELSQINRKHDFAQEIEEINIKKNVEFLQRTDDAYKSEKGKSLFAGDSLFIITLMDANDEHYRILCSGKKSCWYRYKETIYTNGHISFDGFRFYSDASRQLEKLPNKVKTWIINSDTVDFKTYAGHLLTRPFCCVISFIKAVQTKRNHWKFIKVRSDDIDL